MYTCQKMKFAAVLVCCVLASAQAFAVNTVEDVLDGRIIGGTEEAANSKKPWMAFIQIVDAADATIILNSCGGSIVNNKTVITSAHCFSELKPGGSEASRIKLYLGDFDPITNTVVATAVSNYTANPGFYDNSNEFDIGIITLGAAVVETDKIRYLNMPTKNVISKPDNLAGKKGIVFGWGTKTQAGTTVEAKFNSVPMKILPQKECISTMVSQNSYTVFDSMVCADTAVSTVGFCKYDSGGPLTIQLPSATMPTLYAVASYYETCGTPYPNVFTRLGAKDVLKWIAANGGPPAPK